jgi:hypothetical protein
LFPAEIEIESNLSHCAKRVIEDVAKIARENTTRSRIVAFISQESFFISSFFIDASLCIYMSECKSQNASNKFEA